MSNNLYEKLKKDWVGKKLYDSKFAGSINVFEDRNYVTNSRNLSAVEVWHVPKLQGWKDDAQRNKFRRQAKLAGLIRKKGTICEYYKFI